MARKVKLTRPELKKQRDQLARFDRYLPMLKLKQQQLQLTVREVEQQRREAAAALDEAKARFEPYHDVTRDTAGVNVEQLSTPSEVKTSTRNIAGVVVPVFEEALFPEPRYSLFATPPWVDRAIGDLKDISRATSQVDVLTEKYNLLQAELTRIIQRVNLFEKVKIPEARESIRRIRIHLGDEMTAAVGRAKIAKSKLADTGASGPQQYDSASHEEAAP